jgi:antitoxin ParD1/3/4
VLYSIAILFGTEKNQNLTFVPIFGNFEKNKQMDRNTSISLGSYFDQFIQSRISAGRYKNASEVVRAGLRLLEEEESKMNALKAAIQEGIESSVVNDFDPDYHLKTIKAKKDLNG